MYKTGIRQTCRFRVSQQTVNDLLQRHTVLLKVLFSHSDAKFKGSTYLLGQKEDHKVRGDDFGWCAAVTRVISTHCDVVVLGGLRRVLRDLAATSGRLPLVLEQRNLMIVTNSAFTLEVQMQSTRFTYF